MIIDFFLFLQKIFLFLSNTKLTGFWQKRKDDFIFLNFIVNVFVHGRTKQKYTIWTNSFCVKCVKNTFCVYFHEQNASATMIPGEIIASQKQQMCSVDTWQKKGFPSFYIYIYMQII